MTEVPGGEGELAGVDQGTRAVLARVMDRSGLAGGGGTAVN
jgi:hypothetical protein